MESEAGPSSRPGASSPPATPAHQVRTTDAGHSLESFPALPEPAADQQPQPQQQQRQRKEEANYGNDAKATGTVLSPTAPDSSSPSPTISGRVTTNIRSIFGTASVTPAAAVAATRTEYVPPRDPNRQPPATGVYLFCKHSFEEGCRCKQPLRLGEGDYCARCWEGRCNGTKPPR